MRVPIQEVTPVESAANGYAVGAFLGYLVLIVGIGVYASRFSSGEPLARPSGGGLQRRTAFPVQGNLALPFTPVASLGLIFSIWLQFREFFNKLVAEMPNDTSQDIESRALQAEKIAQDPGRYKVCLCCDSIVTTKVVICPNCHGYRFEDDQSHVASHARYLGTREQSSVLASDLE